MAHSKSKNEDPRLREIIIKIDQSTLPTFKHSDHSKIGIAILGFPFDEGCKRNGGRIGAKNGPSVFREHLYKIGCDPNPECGIKISEKIMIYDFGDVDASLDYDASHSKLSQMIEQLMRKQLIPFVIGGSNDESFFNFLGFANYLRSIRQLTNNFSVINVDAHFDVRAKKKNFEHSGSPFRMLLESKIYRNDKGKFTEFGCQGHQCSNYHFEWIKRRSNTKVVWLSRDLRKREKSNGISVGEQFDELLNEQSGRRIFVSFDVDSIRQADCPGVSCPSPIGLTAVEAAQICFNSGKNKNVSIVDMSEFNPNAESYRTGKLLSWMFYNFVLGVATRNNKNSKM